MEKKSYIGIRTMCLFLKAYVWLITAHVCDIGKAKYCKYLAFPHFFLILTLAMPHKILKQSIKIAVVCYANS